MLVLKLVLLFLALAFLVHAMKKIRMDRFAKDPPAWALGQDPTRCEYCGKLFEKCKCDEGAWDYIDAGEVDEWCSLW